MKKVLPIFTIIIIALIVIFLPKAKSESSVVYTQKPLPVKTHSPKVLEASTSGEFSNGEEYDGFLIPKDLQ